MTSKRKPGRPSLPPEQRAAAVTVRLGPGERTALAELRDRWGTTPSEAIRRALLICTGRRLP